MKYSQAIFISCIGISTVAINNVSAFPWASSNALAARQEGGSPDVTPAGSEVAPAAGGFSPGKPGHHKKMRSGMGGPRGHSHRHAGKRELSETQLKREVDFEDLFARTHEQDNFQPKPLKRAKGFMFSREYDDGQDLAARMFEGFRAKYRAAKAERLQHEADKAALKAGTGGSTGGVDPSITARGLEEFEEELLARGLGFGEEAGLKARAFERFRQKYREAKAGRLQHKAQKAALKAGGSGGGGGADDAGAVSRDLVHNDFLEERDWIVEDDIFEARELLADDQVFEARSLRDVWKGFKGVRKQNKAQHLQQKVDLAAGKAAVASGGSPTPGMSERGFEGLESINDLD